MEQAQLATLAERIGLPLTEAEQAAILPAVEKALARSPELDVEAATARAGWGPYSSAALSDSYAIGGSVEPGFEPVRAGFEQNFKDGLERDAQLCIYWRGRRVVDLWGSTTHSGRDGRPYSKLPGEYDGDTLQTVFSSTKCAAATVFALAQDRGLLRYDDLVSKHWPEFGCNGKEALTIADILRHDAGLQAFDEPISKEDVERQHDPDGKLSRVIAETTPWTWAGGPDAGKTPRIYHGSSRGLVLSQILLRADPQHRTVGEWLMQEIALPLGIDFFCGPGGEGAIDWASKPSATMTPPEPEFVFANDTLPKLIRKTFPEKYPEDEGTRAMRAYTSDENFQHNPARDDQGKHVPSGGAPPENKKYDSPSGNGWANARGMAKMMAMLSMGGAIDGVRLLSKQGVEAAIQNPVRNTTRNNEAALNRMLPTGDTAFVQGGFDAFLRRDGRNLVAPMERMRPENFVLHGTDAYGTCSSSLANWPSSNKLLHRLGRGGRQHHLVQCTRGLFRCATSLLLTAARVGVSLSSK